jgi:hypothetical protein
LTAQKDKRPRQSHKAILLKYAVLVSVGAVLVAVFKILLGGVGNRAVFKRKTVFDTHNFLVMRQRHFHDTDDDRADYSDDSDRRD